MATISVWQPEPRGKGLNTTPLHRELRNTSFLNKFSDQKLEQTDQENDSSCEEALIGEPTVKEPTEKVYSKKPMNIALNVMRTST
jgi:hypothetical protein